MRFCVLSWVDVWYDRDIVAVFGLQNFLIAGTPEAKTQLCHLTLS